MRRVFQFMQIICSISNRSGWAWVWILVKCERLNGFDSSLLLHIPDIAGSFQRRAVRRLNDFTVTPGNHYIRHPSMSVYRVLKLTIRIRCSLLWCRLLCVPPQNHTGMNSNNKKLQKFALCHQTESHVNTSLQFRIMRQRSPNDRADEKINWKRGRINYHLRFGCFVMNKKVTIDTRDTFQTS